MADEYADGDSPLDKIFDVTIKSMSVQESRTVIMRHGYHPNKPLLNIERLELPDQDVINGANAEMTKFLNLKIALF